ncbi:hypothetical protein [Paenibacillus apiarius]|uniref:hypothetical protein n=1 Tax=Paenibacillus apiarius TaxID=46240 RepID=UPI003B3B4329
MNVQRGYIDFWSLLVVDAQHIGAISRMAWQGCLNYQMRTKKFEIPIQSKGERHMIPLVSACFLFLLFISPILYGINKKINKIEEYLSKNGDYTRYH